MTHKKYEVNMENEKFKVLNELEIRTIDGGAEPNLREKNNILVIGLSSIISFFTKK